MKKGMILLLMVSCLTVTVFAHEVPDLSRCGSLEVDPGVSGGTLTIFRVGEVLEENGNYSFALAEDFVGSGLSLDDPDSADLAEDLAQYVLDHDLTGVTQQIGDSVLFEKLQLGLYLVVQEKAAPGYNLISPFLVSVPMLENGVYVYDVNATPKMGAVFQTEPPGTQTSKPADPTLPQTGQLNWPVAVLTVLGMGLAAAGWSMRKREQ